MDIPVVCARVEERSLLFRLRINAHQVWAFVIVAFATRPGERLRVVRYLVEVLFGNDVIDVIDEVGNRRFA
jgi:hypothetical protein